MEKYKDGSDAAQVQSEESNEQQKIIENERFKSAELEMRLKSAEGLLNQQKKNFESITTELEQQLDQVNLAFSESRDKLRESESLIQTLRNEKEELEKQKSEPVNLPTTDEPNQLQSQRINELEHLIRNMENEHSNDKTKLDQLEKKGLESYMLIRDLSERLREEHGIEVEGTDSDDVNYKIRNLVFSCKGLIVTLNEKIRYQENQFIELQNNMVDVKQKMEQNSNQLLHLHEENQYLRSQFNIAQDSVEELTAAKNSLQDELKKAKDDLRTIISERKNLEENTVEAELFKLHATSKIEKKQAELEEQVALLEKQKSDMEQNKKMMDQWVGENEMLKKTMIGLNETIRDLQSAYVETDGKLKLERMEYDNKIRELERKLNVNEAEAAKYREAMKELEEKNSQLENTVADLKMELEEFEKGNANPPPPPEPTVEIKQQYKMIESGFAVPPVVRQFIISAITCDANKREESSLLLANIIGCTQEEKNQIEECFQNRGLWGLLRGSSSKGPQNIKELSSKFIEFLEKETTQPMGVANVDNSEPIRIDHDIQPVATSSNSDLKAIVSEK
ncbi:unnamed protein product [Bursaphelenchus okinawaensis]|uniref:GRIP domain-containing protein n=1 Tax=Bursaphelenchus okinawaensis TaxID=465554 RepID=A0A811KJC4_9BILA|nr:unnamed protein product [Bursaphelenchus okinawaensis]CAG9104916.1 unnamed protein product [Bursaphelenchus okinawaensis]